MILLRPFRGNSDGPMEDRPEPGSLATRLQRTTENDRSVPPHLGARNEANASDPQCRQLAIERFVRNEANRPRIVPSTWDHPAARNEANRSAHDAERTHFHDVTRWEDSISRIGRQRTDRPTEGRDRVHPGDEGGVEGAPSADRRKTKPIGGALARNEAKRSS
jgi:hypothetical protein